MKSVLLPALLFAAASASSQRLSGYVALGMGSSIEDNNTAYSSANTIRYTGSMTVYYRVNGRLSIGAEAIGSGPLNVFGSASREAANPSDNSILLNPSNLKAGTVLVRNKIVLFSYKEWEPYIDMGIGLNTYYYKDPVQDAGTIKRSSFVFSPGFGVNIQKFQFAVKLISAGKTPSFSGSEPESGKPVTLQSVKAQQLYLTIGYQLFRL